MKLKKILSWFVSLFASAALNREDILSANDVLTREVPVPEWGGSVYLRQLGVEQRMEFLAGISRTQEVSKGGPLEGAKAYFEVQCMLLVHSIVNEVGEPEFVLADVAALSKKSPAVINRLYDEIVLFNRFNASAVEDEAKN